VGLLDVFFAGEHGGRRRGDRERGTGRNDRLRDGETERNDGDFESLRLSVPLSLRL
jgi:hypothetical protein